MHVTSIIGGAEPRGCVMPTIPDDDAWAVTEFIAAELGDSRRTQRLVALATVFAQRPGASLPEACGNRAMLKAAYRFFDNAAIAPQAILESHVIATTGLGPLAAPTHPGLHVHTTLALTPEGLPLGLLAQQVWARDPAAVGTRTTRKHRPIADKESQQWLTRVEAVCEAHAYCPQTRFVCIGDREADV